MKLSVKHVSSWMLGREPLVSISDFFCQIPPRWLPPPPPAPQLAQNCFLIPPNTQRSETLDRGKIERYIIPNAEKCININDRVGQQKCVNHQNQAKQYFIGNTQFVFLNLVVWFKPIWYVILQIVLVVQWSGYRKQIWRWGLKLRQFDSFSTSPAMNSQTGWCGIRLKPPSLHDNMWQYNLKIKKGCLKLSVSPLTI